MQDRLKQMAEEAGIALDPHEGIARAYQVNLERFAQAIARECAEICMQRAIRAMPVDEGWTEQEWDLIQGACELDAVAIEERFGLATPPGDDIKQD